MGFVVRSLNALQGSTLQVRAFRAGRAASVTFPRRGLLVGQIRARDVRGPLAPGLTRAERVSQRTRRAGDGVATVRRLAGQPGRRLR